MDAEVQVLTKGPRLHQRFQGLVAGEDQAYVHRHWAHTANPQQGALLDEVQQPDLHLGPGAVDLVEQQGAAVGQFQQPALAPDGPGEGPGLVAEQLALGQPGRHRGAAQAEKGPIPARAGAMDHAGGDTLAGPGLAVEQYRDLEPRHLIDEGQCPTGGGAAGHGCEGIPVLAADLGAQALDAPAVVQDTADAPQQCPNLGGIEGLDDQVEQTAAEGVHRHRQGGVTCDQDRGEVRGAVARQA